MGFTALDGNEPRPRSETCCEHSPTSVATARQVSRRSLTRWESDARPTSPSRNELIKKGLAYAPERGYLAFTVPGMHEFILRKP